MQMFFCPFPPQTKPDTPAGRDGYYNEPKWVEIT